MGVYRIRNTLNGKSYVGFSTDLPARLSRHKAELKFGSHRNTELLSDWKLLGESGFEFEVLDELEHEENSKSNPAEELRTLTEIWIRKLEKEGSSVVSLS
jgi:group I intron endonuclease